jgi:hypothetical protein
LNIIPSLAVLTAEDNSEYEDSEEKEEAAA